MTAARIKYQITEHELMVAEVETDANHPDALTDCEHRVEALFRQGLTDVYCIARVVEE